MMKADLFDSLVAKVALVVVVVMLGFVGLKIVKSPTASPRKILLFFLAALLTPVFWYLIQLTVFYTLSLVVPQNPIVNCIYLNKTNCRARSDCQWNLPPDTGLGKPTRGYCGYAHLVTTPEPKPSPSSEKCGLENCHGLELSCGSNVPDVCTFLYQIGDNCRQYAKCEVVNNRCQLITEPKFTQCKSCVEKCLVDFANDPIKTSACEGQCQDYEPMSEP